MEKAIFVAKIMGPLYLLVSLSMLLSFKDFMKVYHDVAKSPALMFVSAMLSLVAGLLLVNSYNVWAMDWTLIITVMGWAAMAKGLMLLFAPEWGVKLSNALLKNQSLFMGALVVVGLFGAYVSYIAYWTA